MTKIYTKATWTDEALAGAERYDIKEDAGTAFKSNMQIALATSVAVAGTEVNAAKMNNIEIGLDALDTKVADAVDLFTTGGTSTAFTITTTGAAALVTGESFRVKFHTTAGANPTLNRDGKGAKSLKYYSVAGTKIAITSVNVIANMISTVLYDGTDYITLNIHDVPIAETNVNNIFYISSPGGTSAWAGTFTAAGSSGSTIKYANTSGSAGAMTPGSTTQLGKIRLYNTTRGNNVLISNHVAGTITSTANYPANWVNGDVLTIESQTVNGGSVGWVDVEITSGLTEKTNVFLKYQIISANVGDAFRIHPSSPYSAAKQETILALVANVSINGFGLIPLINNVFSVSWTGTPTNLFIRESGYLS